MALEDPLTRPSPESLPGSHGPERTVSAPQLASLSVGIGSVTLWLGLLGLVTTPIMIHHLGATRYGVFALISIMSAYLMNLEFGFGTATVRFLARAYAAGAVTALLPSLERYGQAQLTRAITRAGTAELFGAVSRIRGLRGLEDPAFQDRLRVAAQVGAAAPAQVTIGVIGALRGAVLLGGFLGTLAVLSPPMAAVVFVAAVPAIYLQRGMARRQTALFHSISHSQRRQYFYSGLLTNLAAAKEIRLLGLGTFFRGEDVVDSLAYRIGINYIIYGIDALTGTRRRARGLCRQTK